MTTTTPDRTGTPRRATLGGVRRSGNVPLPEGALPCRACGVAVRRPDTSRAELLNVALPMALSQIAARPAGPPPSVEVPATRCVDCIKRRIRAETLLGEHRRVASEHGNVGVDRADAALAALDLLGFRGRRVVRMVATLTGTDAALRDFIERLAPLGGAAAWSASYAAPDQSAAGRWGHIGDELRRAAAVAHRGLVHRLAEPLMPFAPPGSLEGSTLPGCGFCGVAVLRVRESDATAAWGNERHASRGVLGGRRRPEPIRFHLCPPCRTAVDAVGGAMGLPAIERALLRYLGFKTIPGAQVTFQRVAAWAALKPGTEPNRTPWAHLDVAALERALDRALYVRREDKRRSVR